MAQSVEHPTSAQVMISRFLGFEPHVGLCADSSGPEACFRSVSSSPSASPPRSLSLCLKNKFRKKKKEMQNLRPCLQPTESESAFYQVSQVTFVYLKVGEAPRPLLSKYRPVSSESPEEFVECRVSVSPKSESLWGNPGNWNFNRFPTGF